MERGTSLIASPDRSHGEIIRARSDAAAQLRAQLFGDVMGVRSVADDLRPDEDDQLGPRGRLVLMRGGIATPLDLVQHRNAAAVAILLLADQAGEQHGLPGCDRERTLDL